MITRKIPFTLIFVLLLSPIVAAENLVGAVVKKSPETFLVEQAGKQVAKILLGKAADKIFGNEMNKMQDTLIDKIEASQRVITNEINNLSTQIRVQAYQSELVAHGVHVAGLAGPVTNQIGLLDSNINYGKADSVQLYIQDLKTLLASSRDYSTALDEDISIGTHMDNKWNGFWRSFPAYVSNQTTFAVFNTASWQARVRGEYSSDTQADALIVVNKNLANLENIYKHLERNVPTMPISAGSPLERHLPIQQNLNCVIRTDPDTQLVTSKGELIRRYAGYDDVADHLPSATNVWRMWGYCRGDKSNQPPTYYGWANTNYEWAAGTHVGPTDDINECRQISTFGRCQAKGFKYGCTMTPNSDPRHNQSHQGPEPRNIDTIRYATNEIENKRGRTWYTKFQWSEEPKVLDGSPAHMGRGPNQGKWDKSSLTGQGTFVNYLRTWENTVCAMGPDGKQISQEFPNAPALPHLPTKDLTSTPESYPKKITDSLPLTVIKTMTPAAYGVDLQQLTDTSAVYYFIKRNHTNKTAELSKPYQSELSAAHDRSLHYFTEFKDEGLPTAYCQVAALASLNDNFLKSLTSKPGSVDAASLDKAALRARQISYKLGITKENAAGCFSEPKSNHIVASLHDQMTQAIEVSDHMIRSCLKYAALTNYFSHKSHAFTDNNKLMINYKIQLKIRAACDAHGAKTQHNKYEKWQGGD